jgi:5-methylcytosine-specific restriction endonuclease McrA
MPSGVYKRTEKHRKVCKANGAMRKDFFVSESTREKIRLAQIGIARPQTRGSKNASWKGGTTSKDQTERTRVEFKNWRRKVFSINENLCIMCGCSDKKLLVAHHKKPLKDFPEIAYDPKNAVILCRVCHPKVHNRWWLKEI